MGLIFVDCEADGPCPGMGDLTEFGAVDYKTRDTFHGVLWRSKPDAANPAISRKDPNAIQKSRAERHQVWAEFEAWIKAHCKDGRAIMVSDNPAFDFQWINYGFWHELERNPFGHSARRIGDFAAGLLGNFYARQDWKKLRRTPHDHHPVNDAMGNVEAFEQLTRGECCGKGPYAS